MAASDSGAGRANRPWFDDSATLRYLGGRDWLDRLPMRVRIAPGQSFRGRQILTRHALVACERVGMPCALVDVETHSDVTAGFALVVDPARRGCGVAQRVLLAVAARPGLARVDALVGAIEPENIPARTCFAKAGFRIAATPDDEGMLPMRWPIQGRPA